ncbi:hypothetical protein AB1Y20_000128 [Prymnesium parvum]|uniref:Calcineurin-like phosphoesterase domain-containing protein n=1 Tax=Prymnesium parvum TaxID=97485 RepID=A0AB34K414_PRYPA
MAPARVMPGFSRSGPKATWEQLGAFSFVQLADTQFGMLDQAFSAEWYRRARRVLRVLCCWSGLEKRMLPVPGFRVPSSRTPGQPLIEVEKDFARRAVRAINRMAPRPVFAIVCGDLVNSFPNTQPTRHEAEVAEFKEIFRELHPDIALVCVCGNHDVGERPTAATIEAWRADFGDDYFSFWVGGVKFVCINSQLYKDASGAPELAMEQDRWLDAELSLARSEGARRVIVFSHIPPFIHDPDEGSGYFPLEKEVRHRLLAKMASNNVSHWFCGHYHRNAGGVYCLPCTDPEGNSVASSSKNRLEVVTTAALGANIGTDPSGDPINLSGMSDIYAELNSSGLRVVDIDEHNVSHRFMSLLELQEK